MLEDKANNESVGCLAMKGCRAAVIINMLEPVDKAILRSKG